MKKFAILTLILTAVIILSLPAIISLAETGAPAPAITPTTTPISNAISLQVKASADDTSVQLATGDNRHDWVYIRIGSSETDYVDGLRFQNVDIPAGSQIVQAKLVLYYGEWTRNLPIRVKIQADNTDSAQSFADSNPLASQRPLTSAAVDWEITHSPPNYSWFESPDIAAVIQEIVARPGWQDGNALAIILQNAANNEQNHYLDVQSYDFNPGIAPKLEIVYETHVPIPTSTPTVTPTPTITPTPEPGRLAIEQAKPLACNARITGNTKSWDNNVVDYTACRPAWPETGPEAVYRLELAYDNTDVQLQVFSDDPAQDLDVFLLTSAYPDDCVQGADASLAEKQMNAGTYYVAVDGYNGAAGAFTLVSNCTVHFEHDLYLPMMTR
jgi:hypothetical protein